MKDTWFIYVRAPRAETLTFVNPVTEFRNGLALRYRDQRHIPLGHPLACIAVRVVEEIQPGDALKGQPPLINLAYGVSIWNPMDAFNRLTAREKALGRAKMFRAPTILLPKDLDYKAANRRVLLRIYDEGKLLKGYKDQGDCCYERIPSRVLTAMQAALEGA